MSFSVDEVAFLASHADEIAAARKHVELTKASSLKDGEYLRSKFGEYGRALAELYLSRRAAQGKVDSTWLVDHDSAQQATPAVVARWRAERIAALNPDWVCDVTCSIGSEGQALTDQGLTYVGADIDASRAVMASYNLQNSHQAYIVRADALRPVVREPAAQGPHSVIVADPARRSGSGRIRRPEDMLPPLPELTDSYARYPQVIKCAPGMDYSQWQGSVSIVSVSGAVKEACLFSEQFHELFPHSAAKTPTLRREAVMISETGIDSIDDSSDDDIGVGSPGRYIFDPDGAVVRAGLVRHFAHREGMWMLDERIAYLTGNRLPEGASGFEFIEQVSIKKLKAALAAHNCGSVEILVRGVDIDPDRLRSKLKLKGTNPMAVVLTRIGRQGVALVCGPRTKALD